jgi:hypothetical protein
MGWNQIKDDEKQHDSNLYLQQKKQIDEKLDAATDQKHGSM